MKTFKKDEIFVQTEDHKIIKVFMVLRTFTVSDLSNENTTDIDALDMYLEDGYLRQCVSTEFSASYLESGAVLRVYPIEEQ